MRVDLGNEMSFVWGLRIRLLVCLIIYTCECECAVASLVGVLQLDIASVRGPGEYPALGSMT